MTVRAGFVCVRMGGLSVMACRRNWAVSAVSGFVLCFALGCVPASWAQSMLSVYQFGLSPLVVSSSLPIGTVVAVTRIPVGAALPDCLRTAQGTCLLRMSGPEMWSTNISGLSVRVDAVERQMDTLLGAPDEDDFQPYHSRVRTARTGGYRIALVKTGVISGGFLREVRGDFIFEYQRPDLADGSEQSVFTERLRYQGVKPVRVESDSAEPVCPGGLGLFPGTCLSGNTVRRAS